MLLDARARLLRLEFERARRRIPHVPATVQHEALENQLKVARSRARKLEQQVGRLKSGASAKNRELQHEIKLLQAGTSRAEELEKTVERLKVAASRAEQLEEEVERLRAGASRAEELEQEVEEAVEGLKVAASRAEQLEEEVERLRARRLEDPGARTGARRGRSSASRPLAQERTSSNRSSSASGPQPRHEGPSPPGSPKRDLTRGGPKRGDDL